MTLIDSLATTNQLAKVFSDDFVLRAALDFEVALARVEARLGIISKTAADVIAAASAVEAFDTAALGRDMRSSATFGVPFAKMLTDRIRSRDEESAKFVHWGATSQDVADTTLILLLKKAKPVVLGDIGRLERALERLAEEHGDTVMLGRTLMQAAPPITFGLKAAGWLGAVRRCRMRLEQAFSEGLVVQFGGATGTLAALQDRGLEVGRALAEELDLGYPEAPWHTHRDRLAALVCACGVLTASLGKVACDIVLLSQNEVAEVSEPSGPGRGGSSTMPHKQNPVGSVLVLAAANRVPALVASYLSAMVQEHERAAGAWQSEWSTVADVIQATGSAVAAMAEAAEGLKVDGKRMQENIAATNGLIFAERAMILLASALGREEAQKLIQEVTRRSVSEGKSLVDVLRETLEITNVLDADTLASLDDPRAYLGVAEEFRKRLLAGKDGPKT
jgi:3-carboxy-cis,cis-muconate cycloisomerase